MLEGEGLRKEILSKTHHSPYTVYPGSIKMYKDKQRSELEYSTYLSSSLEMPPYEALCECKDLSPLYLDNVGSRQRWGLK